MRALVITAIGCAAAIALAQEVSDLPTTSTAPPQQPGAPPRYSPYYPGMPQPQPPPASGGTTSGDAKEKRKGLILSDEDDSEPGDLAAAPGGPPPETYVIKKGDTLSGLSSRYFQTPAGWPKLWSYNPSVTNPHWIYPGDVIRIAPPGGAPAPEPRPTVVGPRLQAPPRQTGLLLRQTGFVEPGELKQAGRIVGSKEEKMMLGTLDEAYVEPSKHKPFVVGEHHTIYHPTREVRHPLTGKMLGHLVEILGEAEVRAAKDSKVSRIGIVDSINPIERGYLVGPVRRQFKIVSPVPNKVEQEGIIVATLQPRNLIGAEHIIFIDRGKLEGVELGNRFFVTRRGDGYPAPLQQRPIDDRRFPREIIAEVLVVDLRDHLATGFVTRANHEAHVGDRVEAKKGY